MRVVLPHPFFPLEGKNPNPVLDKASLALEHGSAESPNQSSVPADEINQWNKNNNKF